jgi:prepilin-type N-terminal cleavage/methylation domain-containing protein
VTGATGRTAAFTLIEMMAVVALMAVMAALVVPNLGSLQARQLRQEALQMAGQLELARQRSVMTGVPHRLLIDLDGGSYRLEWLVTEAQALGEPEPDAQPLDLSPDVPLPLQAPSAGRRDYHPAPPPLGADHWLDDDFMFVGMQTPEGWLQHGDAYIGFDRDGTSVAATVVMDAASGARMTLVVLPLAEAVRIHDDTS